MSSMTDRAYSALRAQLLDGTMHPHQRLVEMDLVESLGANRAAVREALARLEQEGLVERRANRGVTVKAVSPEEAHDVLEMRIAIESLAVRWACERQTEQQSDQLRELLGHIEQQTQDGDTAGIVEQQARVHHMILDMAASPKLVAIAHSLSAQTAQIRRRSLTTPGRLPESLAEHRRIAEAILARDAERAASEMTQHLRRVQAVSLHA
jgi:DNA-binding GntR family transcriptional regulator